MRILGDSYATKGDYQKAIECYNKSNDFSNPNYFIAMDFLFIS